MTCTANVQKGRDLVFLIRNDQDTEWEIAGGVQVRGFTFDNPVEEVTSSSTPGEYTESEWTGYSNASLDISGVADQRTGIVDPVTGLTVVGSARLLSLATSGDRCAKIQMRNVDTNGTIEGFFNITNFNKSGNTPGLLNFTATLNSKADVTVVGEV